MIPITMPIQIVIAFMLLPEEWFMSRWILMAMVVAQTLNLVKTYVTNSRVQPRRARARPLSGATAIVW